MSGPNNAVGTLIFIGILGLLIFSVLNLKKAGRSYHWLWLMIVCPPLGSLGVAIMSYCFVHMREADDHLKSIEEGERRKVEEQNAKKAKAKEQQALMEKQRENEERMERQKAEQERQQLEREASLKSLRATLGKFSPERLRLEYEKRERAISELKADIRHEDQLHNSFISDRENRNVKDQAYSYHFEATQKLNEQINQIRVELAIIEDILK